MLSVKAKAPLRMEGPLPSLSLLWAHYKPLKAPFEPKP